MASTAEAIQQNCLGGYALIMKLRILVASVVVLGGQMLLPCPAVYGALTQGADADTNHYATSVSVAPALDDILATIIDSISPLSPEAMLRRNVAQATFCLPQNILGIACYALLQLTGAVVDVVEMNEVKIVVTHAPFGVSLGKVIILHSSLVSEYAVRHEYGHTLQGYKHGPFYLLFEGLTSFLQAGVSLISPSFAAGYYDRWPENEANELGGN